MTKELEILKQRIGTLASTLADFRPDRPLGAADRAMLTEELTSLRNETAAVLQLLDSATKQGGA